LSSIFRARLVTPERVLFDDEVEAVMLRTGDGQIAFLAGHAPVVGSVQPGVLRMQLPDGKEQRAAVHGGFVRTEGGETVIAAPIAELAEEIDVERARARLRRAEELIAMRKTHAEMEERRRAEHAEEEHGVTSLFADAHVISRQKQLLRLQVAGHHEES